MAVHEFGPRWIDVDPRGIDDYALPGEEFDTVDLVFDYYEPPQADADDFATHYELTTEQHNQLTAILDAETPDDPFTGIVRILGLPDEAAEVAEGWRDPHDLPAAELFHPKRLGAALWDSLTTLPTENTVNARMHRAWITRPPCSSRSTPSKQRSSESGPHDKHDAATPDAHSLALHSSR